MFDTLTLGELINKLEKQPKDQLIYFDFSWLHPTTLHSYRGHYDHLALGFAIDQHPASTVTNLLKICEEAIGKTFTGWKGGNFLMGSITPVWAANNGHTGNYIVDVRNIYGSTILITKYKDE